MRLTTRAVAIAAAVAGTITVITAGAASAAVPSATAPAVASVAPLLPRGFQPAAMSWSDARHGVLLGYASPRAGVPAYLFTTADGGRHWGRLSAPPVPQSPYHDGVSMSWSGQDGVVSNGANARLAVTHDGGRHWRTVTLVGAVAPKGGSLYLARTAVARGMVFALVDTEGMTGRTTVYAGPVTAGALRAVPGLSITGGMTYGDLTAIGGMRVYLGADYTKQRYWYTRADRLVPGPAPCPVGDQASLGGVVAGRDVALCSGSPSDVGPGENEKQLAVAARPGAPFRLSGKQFVGPNTMGFAAGSARVAAVATAFAVFTTADAGATWRASTVCDDGANWTGLTFPTATTGYVLRQSADDKGGTTTVVLRTTDAGRTWAVLPLA